jgi:phosphoribosyl 1,2-cyclic phosphodiesterase
MKRKSLQKTHRAALFQARFWGVRGSYPTASPNTLGFGGNTSCVEVTVAGRRLIFDAGTGIIALGKTLRDHPTSYIFLSHTHIDHIMGLCFFEPLLIDKTFTFIFGPAANRKSLARSLQQLTRTSLFPIALDELNGGQETYSLRGGEVIHFKPRSIKPIITRRSAASHATPGEAAIVTYKSPAHPRDGVMLYRVNYQGKSLVYATDIEQPRGGYPDIVDFVRGADLLIHDAQYLHHEYFSNSMPRKGWGHSTIEMATEVAKKAKVKQLVLFHHEPTHDDRAMRRIERQAKRLFPATLTAYEGMELSL